MPRFAEQLALALKLPGSSVRVHNDVDVGGSYGVKRGIKHAVLIGYLARRLGFPVRLIEDRLENMRGGDAHGPERNFDLDIAFDDAGVIRSMKMRALDNVGAYAGRSPFQLGKPISAIVGPYRINSVQYQAIAVLSNKTTQEAVRAFGQSPTNFAIERAIEEVAKHRGLDRIEVRRRNFIRKEQFPYLMPSGTTYDSGDYHTVVDKVLAQADYAALIAERDRLRSQGTARRHRHRRLPRAERRQFDVRAAAQSGQPGHDLFGGLPHQRRPGRLGDGDRAYDVGRAGARDAGRHRGRRGAADRPRSHPGGAPDSLSALPSQSPVGSRMAIMLGGAAYHAAQKLKARMIAIAAHDLGIPAERIEWRNGDAVDRTAPEQKRTWTEIVTIAHRYFHRLPPDTEPGLAFSHNMMVPMGGKLPTEDGRVQMYPCFAFEFHLILVTIDPVLGKLEFQRYLIGHDCGTVINPKIVRGMTMGGIAHGIGAALYEEFAYSDDGLLMAQTFMDYLLPSSHEVPPVEVVHHETPSPHTVFGQKGSGESGYLGAPAAITSAVNDALAPLGLAVNRLPIKMTRLSDMIAAAKNK